MQGKFIFQFPVLALTAFYVQYVTLIEQQHLVSGQPSTIWFRDIGQRIPCLNWCQLTMDAQFQVCTL